MPAVEVSAIQLPASVSPSPGNSDIVASSVFVPADGMCPCYLLQ